MQHCKQNDFNPLDILATAAALKQTDKPEQHTKQKIVIVRPKDGVKIIPVNQSEGPSTSTDDKKSNKKPLGLIKTTSYVEDGVKKVKLTISSELEKMLNEHNYGSIQKLNTGNKSIIKLPDVLSLGKDKKVIVKVVDKSGDHVPQDGILTAINISDKISQGETTPTEEKQSEALELKCNNEIFEGVEEDSLKPVKNSKEEDNPQSTDSQENLKENNSIDQSEDLQENLCQNPESSPSYKIPDCKPVEIDDFDVCSERLDSDIRSPVYEDIDFHESHKTPPSDKTALLCDQYNDQSLNIKCSIDDDDANNKDGILTSEENSISAQTDKQNKVLEKDIENQYGDNDILPGKIDTGANNTDRCDMGKSQALDRINPSSIEENSSTVQNISEEKPSVDNNSIHRFSMIDHEYAEKYCDDSSDGRNDSLSDVPLNSDFSQDSGFSDSGLSPDGLESRTFRRDSPSLIPVKSEMLPSFDLSDVNKARDAIVALVNSKVSPVSPQDGISQTSTTRTSPKVGKFSIGTFASVCNSTLGLQSPEKSQIAYGQRIATSLLSNNIIHQNKRESPVTCTLPQSDLIDHIEHDHDYSLPYNSRPSNIPFSVQKVNKESTSKSKNKEKKIDGNEKRTKRSNSAEEVKEDKLFDMITCEGERKGSKNDKLADFLKAGTSDSKLKIQGSYKDDFVYFLNTKFRSRRRASQDIPHPKPMDKIIVPLPKPGDIIVPHLTNEDLEAIKLGKHSRLSGNQHTSVSLTGVQQSISSAANSTPKSQNNNSVLDMESRIINTILSMENEPCADTCTSTASTDSGLYAGNESFGINFSDQLTPEQMEILYSAVDQVQSIDSKSSISSNKSESSLETEEEDINKQGISSDLSKESSRDKQAGSDKAAQEIHTKDPLNTHSVNTPKSKISGSSEQLNIFNTDIFPQSNEESKNNSSEAADDSAPWIVTVSMYWNDLPAIMIDNLPYLRLVDIHKQILPAKDTGILKKRCQLLGINVKNCTEMQRYFLVQYGKAFNSKSNLIIGKQNAEFLIGYYVNPVTKLPRPEDHQVKPKITKISKPRSRPPSRAESEKRKNAVAEVTTPVIVEPLPQKPLGRTRHKKINFLELLKGDSNNNSPENSVTEHHEEKKIDSVNVVVVDPPAGWKKSDLLSTSKKFEDAKKKKCVKRSHTHQENRKQKSEEIQTMDSTGESETENIDGERNLTWLSKKRQKLSINRKAKKPGSLKVKWTIFNKSNRKKWPNKKSQREVLTVVHKDMLSSNVQLNNIQSGNVFMDLYNNENSPCVRCCTCNKVFTVEAFLKHLHASDDGKLISVVNPQTLSLRDTSESQKKMWRNFQLKSKRFNSNRMPQSQKVIPKIQSAEKELERVNILPKLPASRSVRISSRKRKQKQLYPIENYSYSKRRLEENSMTEAQSSSHKIVRASSESDVFEENVVTESNGPILTSFTALEHDV